MNCDDIIVRFRRAKVIVKTAGMTQYIPEPFVPNDWPNIKTVLDADTRGYAGKYIALIPDTWDTTQLTGAAAYETSDGAYYTSDTLHTWDKAQDKPSREGYSTRYIIYYLTTDSGQISAPPETLNLYMAVNLINPSTGNWQNDWFYNKTNLVHFQFAEGFNSSQVTSFNYFCGACRALKSFGKLDTSNGTNFSYFLSNSVSLIKIPNLNTSNGVNFSNAFSSTYALAILPKLDFTNGQSFANFGSFMYSLRSFEADFSRASGFYFQSAESLINLKLIISGSNAYFNTLTSLNKDSLKYIAENAPTVSNRTISLGAANIEKAGPDIIAIFTSKGWSVN